MPSTATDTDAFPTTVQRPNNGELADAASLSQGFNPLTQRSRYTYNRIIDRNYDVHRAPYNAVGSGVVNDRPAIAAAIAAAEADGGGTVWLRAGKQYRVDSQLPTLPGNVHLRAMKGAAAAKTTLIRNHIFPLLSIANDDNDTPTVVEGVTFTDAAGGGAMVVVSDGSVDLVRCAMLGVAGVTDNSQPLVLMAGATGSVLQLKRCRLAPVNGQRAISLQTGRLVGGAASTIKVPATYTGDLIEVDSTSSSNPAHLSLSDGFDFDATSHTSGAIICVNADGDSWAISADGSYFRGGSSNTVTCFFWSDAGSRRMNIGHSNVYSAILNRYFPSGTGELSSESYLALKPYLAWDVAGTTYTIPTGVESVALRFQSTAPTITMPPKLFAGQRIRVSVFNQSGAGWTGVTVIGLIFGGTNAINNLTGRSFEAVVVDRNLDGSLDWVIVGGWSEMFL